MPVGIFARTSTRPRVSATFPSVVRRAEIQVQNSCVWQGNSDPAGAGRAEITRCPVPSRAELAKSSV